MLSLSSGGIGLTHIAGASTVIEYATWNPLDKGSNIVLSESNRTAENNSIGNQSVRATLPKTSGKWYYEIIYPDGLGFSLIGTAGFAGTTSNILESYLGASAYSCTQRPEVTSWLSNTPFTATALDAPIGTAPGTIVSVAIDLDTRKAWVGSQGTWLGGDPVAGTGERLSWSESFPMHIALFVPYSSFRGKLNAGQDAFSYAVPAGFNSGWYE